MARTAKHMRRCFNCSILYKQTLIFGADRSVTVTTSNGAVSYGFCNGRCRAEWLAANRLVPFCRQP